MKSHKKTEKMKLPPHEFSSVKATAPDTKPYRRRKPKIIVLSKERMKLFLEKASENNWYLEILLGLFMGLRKGEISGLKFDDFDVETEP